MPPNTCELLKVPFWENIHSKLNRSWVVKGELTIGPVNQIISTSCPQLTTTINPKFSVAKQDGFK